VVALVVAEDDAELVAELDADVVAELDTEVVAVDDTELTAVVEAEVVAVDDTEVAADVDAEVVAVEPTVLLALVVADVVPVDPTVLLPLVVIVVVSVETAVDETDVVALELALEVWVVLGLEMSHVRKVPSACRVTARLSIATVALQSVLSLRKPPITHVTVPLMSLPAPNIFANTFVLMTSLTLSQPAVVALADLSTVKDSPSVAQLRPTPECPHERKTLSSSSDCSSQSLWELVAM
jgi:hypothetical protein